MKKILERKWIDEELLRRFAGEQTDAHRLTTAAEGWVERFGRDVLLSFKSEEARHLLLEEFLSWAQKTGFVWTRVYARFLPRKNPDRIAPQLLLGAAGESLRSVVMERGLRYGVDFGAGYSAGLFIDQRENRDFVRRSAPESVLNCFAYTGSFSVAAALAGARTLNIDLSRKSLSRARENFVLNALSTDGHRFIADDVLEMLPRLARKGERFDLVVLDPPTFSRTRSGKTFHVESDFEGLLQLALELAEPGARILLSTNYSKLGERNLEVMARYCLKAGRRSGIFHRQPLPVEFPPGSAASTLWLTLH